MSIRLLVLSTYGSSSPIGSNLAWEWDTENASNGPILSHSSDTAAEKVGCLIAPHSFLACGSGIDRVLWSFRLEYIRENLY
jgi:hypothetical protein